MSEVAPDNEQQGTPTESQNVNADPVGGGGQVGEGSPQEPQAEPRTYAGKFQSVDDLEKSYLNAEKKLGEQGNELGEVKSTLAKLQEQADKQRQMMAAQLGLEEEVEVNPDLKKLAEGYDVDPVFLQKLAQTVAPSDKFSKLDTVEKSVNSRLFEWEMKQHERDFIREHPDKAELVDDMRQLLNTPLGARIAMDDDGSFRGNPFEQAATYLEYKAYEADRKRQIEQAKQQQQQEKQNAQQQAQTIATNPPPQNKSQSPEEIERDIVYGFKPGYDFGGGTER